MSHLLHGCLEKVNFHYPPPLTAGCGKWCRWTLPFYSNRHGRTILKTYLGSSYQPVLTIAVWALCLSWAKKSLLKSKNFLWGFYWFLHWKSSSKWFLQKILRNWKFFATFCNPWVDRAQRLFYNEDTMHAFSENDKSTNETGPKCLRIRYWVQICITYWDIFNSGVSFIPWKQCIL